MSSARLGSFRKDVSPHATGKARAADMADVSLMARASAIRVSLDLLARGVTPTDLELNVTYPVRIRTAMVTGVVEAIASVSVMQDLRVNFVRLVPQATRIRRGYASRAVRQMKPAMVLVDAGRTELANASQLSIAVDLYRVSFEQRLKLHRFMIQLSRAARITLITQVTLIAQSAKQDHLYCRAYVEMRRFHRIVSRRARLKSMSNAKTILTHV